MKSIGKRFTSLCLVIIFVFFAVPTNVLANTNQFGSADHVSMSLFTQTEVVDRNISFEDVMELERFIYVTENGLFSINHSEAIDAGISLHLLASQTSYFQALNSLIEDGVLVANEDLTIDNLSYFDMRSINWICRVSGGRNSHEIFWWGHRHYTCACVTRDVIYDFQAIAIGAAGLGVAGAWFPIIGVGAGLTSAYFGLLANQMSSHNRGRGIRTDITHLLVFSISSQ